MKCKQDNPKTHYGLGTLTQYKQRKIKVVKHISNSITVESFIFVGLKFRGFQISDKLVGI